MWNKEVTGPILNEAFSSQGPGTDLNHIMSNPDTKNNSNNSNGFGELCLDLFPVLVIECIFCVQLQLQNWFIYHLHMNHQNAVVVVFTS